MTATTDNGTEVIDETPGTPNYVYLQVSATQLDTFAGSRESCNRKWYLDKILKLPTIQNKSAGFGSKFHEVLERWFLAQDHGAPAELYPAGWNEGLSLVEEDLVRRLVSLGLEAGLLAREPDREIESEFFFNLINDEHLKVDVLGYRDLISRSKWLVSDHKTTSAGDYAKTNYTLPRTTQMPLYALSLVIEAMAKKLPVPDEVFVEHNVFCTAMSKGEKREGRKPRAWKVGPVPIKVRGRREPSFVNKIGEKTFCAECVEEGLERERISQPVRFHTDEKARCALCGDNALIEDPNPPTLEEQIDTFIARARAMGDVSQIKTWQAVRGPQNVQAACNAFGGCPFQGLCNGTETEPQYRNRLALVQAEIDKSKSLPTAITENKPAEVVLAPQVPECPTPPPPAPVPASTMPVATKKEHRSMSMAMLRKKTPASNGTAPPPPSAPTPPPPVQQTAPAPTPAPTQPATNGSLASLIGVPPQVNPNPAPPPLVLPRQNPNQAVMPWAVQGCNACKDGNVSHGVASSGRPCVVCEGLAEQDGKVYVPRNYDWKFENGIMTATPKAGTGAPAVSGVAQPAPEAPKAETVPNVSISGPAGAGKEIVQQATADLLGVNLAATPDQRPAGAAPIPTTPPETKPPGKKRGRPRKDAQAQTNGTASTGTTQTTYQVVEAAKNEATQPEQPETSEGFTLCIGCRPTLREITLFDSLWSELTTAYAKAQPGSPSWYSLKPFERTDPIVAKAQSIADSLDGQAVYVPAQRTPEQNALVSALRALASEVYEA